MKKQMFILLTIALVLLVACQPTPESDAIVNKGNGSLEESVFEKADSNEERGETQERINWSETKCVNNEIGECTVTVSVDIDTPVEPKNVPVYLIEPAKFSIDYLKSVTEYLMPGEVYDGRLSKNDVMTEILDAKRLISEHTVRDGMQSEVDNYIDFLSEEYEYAIEDNKDAKFEYITNDYGQTTLKIKSYINDSTIMHFTAYYSDFYFRVRELHTVFFYPDKIPKDITQGADIETTYEQALATADDAVATLFDKPFAMVSATIADKKNYLEYLWNDDDTSLNQAYVFYYTPEYDGFSSLLVDQASRMQTEKTEYAKPYVREYALIIVDDNGIALISYQSYSNSIEKLNDNVGLMPFDEILERFKKEVFYHSLWGKSADIEISQIKFGMVREPVKDNPGQYMMVPAWDFIGNVKSGMVNDQGKSVLTLNAIDGSIITDYESIADPK